MAKLSIVIVNYNVAYFLEQCLRSVMEASKGLDTEIFVVDNHSVDNSVEMLRKQFPEVKLTFTSAIIAAVFNPSIVMLNFQNVQNQE